MASKKAENPDDQAPEEDQGGNFCFNKKEGTVLGRTASSWAKITLFYCIYYGCLAAWFTGLLHAFYSTLDETAPTYYGESSLTLANPGLGVRPMPRGDITLIRFRSGIPSSYYPYTEHLQAFFYSYNNSDGAIPCPDGEVNNSTSGCLVDVQALLEEAGCGKDFGYFESTPCVIIKINKLFGYDIEGQGYSSREEINATIQSMREEEKDKRSPLYKDEMPRFISVGSDGNSVGVSCEGHNALDRQNVKSVTFAPKNGLDRKYFPYRNQKGYRAPFVVFKFDVTHRTLVQVTCKAWAKNIDNSDGQEKRGSTHFELLID